MAMSFQDKKNPNPFFKKTRLGLYGFGGAYRIRTGDLYNANVARYQGIRTLSQIYAPVLQTSQSRTAYQRLYHLEGNSYSTLL